MVKKRYHSVYSDFKSSFFCKFFIYSGGFLILIFVFLSLVSLFLTAENTGFLRDLYNFSKTSYPESILAFSIIFIAIGIILYFFRCQFAKLAKIAEEIENDEIEK